jgi:hypothetical protein
MQRLTPRRFLAWLGAITALGLVVGIVPAAGDPPSGGQPSRQFSVAVFVCIGDTSAQNCGPGRVRLRVTAGAKTKTLTSGPFPDLARRAGNVAILASGKKAFSCPGLCSGLLPSGAAIAIKAKPYDEPNRKYRFVKMDGCTPETQNPCQFTLGRQMKLKVVFAPDYGP